MIINIILFCLLNGGIQEMGYCTAPDEHPQQVEEAELDTNKTETSDEENARNTGGFPLIFYSDQTSLAGGGGLQTVIKGESERQSSSIMLLAFYTANSQYAIQTGTEYYLRGGMYKLTGFIGYLYFPDTFYGIGNNTSDEFEDYTSRLFAFQPTLQRKVTENIYVGVLWGFYHANLVEIDSSADRLLISGTFKGSDGGRVSGPGVTATWDTRDNNMYPTGGSYHQFTVVNASESFGSDYSYSAALVDLRHYRQISEDKILALRGIVGLGFNDPLFQLMWSLGTHLRGYKIPRFIDKNIIVFQTEYRQHLFGRFGYILSGGFGQVAEDVGQVSLGELKPSFGIGIRFALIPQHKFNLRIDFGIGKDDSSFDINFGEAF